MPFQPSSCSSKEAPGLLEVVDLSTECLAVGGGDIRIAQLFQEARAAGYEVSEPVSCRSGDEISGLRPPGYLAQE
jgi:hypothetical protein